MSKKQRTLEKSPKIELRRRESKDTYYFVLISNNGVELVTSKDYATKHGAINGIRALMDNTDSFALRYFRDLVPGAKTKMKKTYNEEEIKFTAEG